MTEERDPSRDAIDPPPTKKEEEKKVSLDSTETENGVEAPAIDPPPTNE